MPLYRYVYTNKESNIIELDIIVYKKEDKDYFNKNDIKKNKKDYS